MLEEEEFRIHGAQGRDEEQESSDNQRFLATEVSGKQSRDGRTNDAADERRCRCESMPPVGVLEILCVLEERLKSFLSTRDDGCVIPEKKPTEHSHQHDGEKIGFATLLILVHSLINFVFTLYSAKVVLFFV